MSHTLDGRKISHEALEEIRMRAVQRVEAGESPEEVVAALGLHRSVIYKWLNIYRRGGFEALKSRKAPGARPKLSTTQQNQLIELLTCYSPLELGFEYALWAQAMVRELLKKEFNVTMTRPAVGQMLHRLGFSPQRPLARAYQRDEERVQTWKQQAYPEFRREARAQRATIYFADESTIRSDAHSGTTWAPVGKTPIVERTGARFSLNMVSAISAQGKLRFMTLKGRMNADHFIEFLERLVYRADRPIFLIVDGHPVHKSRRVREFVESTNGRLRLFVLPPYSPNLNSDEWVWNWLKSHRLGRMRMTGPDQLKHTVHHYLRQLQKLPETLRGFFRDPELSSILDDKSMSSKQLLS